MSDSESNDQTSDSSDTEQNRSNRYKGPASTWQSLTEQERGLAASLDQLRNEDLSIHLYNAHALRKRAREAEESEEGKLKLQKDYPAIPEEDRTFRPPNRWTAWPLPPDEVPRRTERSAEDASIDRYTFKRREAERPSRELEDVLIGITLEFAKERFLAREAEGDEIALSSAADGRSVEGGGENHTDEESDGERIIEPKTKATSLRPVVSADDEASETILRPSIRHTLSKLDEVLMALHHARKTCRRYSQSEPDTDDESVDNIDTEPRKFSNLTYRAKAIPSLEERGPDTPSPAPLPTKTGRRGRPRKQFPRLEGETEEEHLVRIARLQKRVLPPFARSQSRATSRSRTPKSNPPVKRTLSQSQETTKRANKKLGLRDWSEVVGTAALVGFSPDVVKRATQRCADLFGEGMDMRMMLEMPFSEREDANILQQYEPAEIPDLRDFNIVSSSDEEGNEESGTNSSELEQYQNFPDIGNIHCPVKGCPRKLKPFRNETELRQHLRYKHDVEEDNMNEYILPSDEEMEGAVHVDGFLRRIKRPLASVYASQRRKARKEKRRREKEFDDDGGQEEGLEGEGDVKRDMGEVVESGRERGD